MNIRAEVTPQELTSFVSEIQSQTEEGLNSLLEKTREDWEEYHRRFTDLEDKVAQYRAGLFADIFPYLVPEAIARQIQSERTKAGPFSEPGAKRHYLLKHQGWIEVCTLKAQFVGRSNEEVDDNPKNGWLYHLLAILRERGWVVKLRAETYAEVGVGNHATLELCIADPRSEGEIEAALKALVC